jgi:Leucine-rich repeat (LRR) protein
MRYKYDMKELLEFLDKYLIEYKVENGKVICEGECLDLSYKEISTLPKDIGLLECYRLYLDNNLITELPKSFGDMICYRLDLSNNNIPKHNIKYLDRIENLYFVWTDYGYGLLDVKQLCRINTRKDKISSVLDDINS